MDKNQAFATIKNLVDQALSAGVIKSAEHSAQILQALQTLQKEITANNNS